MIIQSRGGSLPAGDCAAERFRECFQAKQIFLQPCRRTWPRRLCRRAPPSNGYLMKRPTSRRQLKGRSRISRVQSSRLQNLRVGLRRTLWRRRKHVSELPKQTRSLVKILRRQTERGIHEWEQGSAETEFVFVHDSGSVIISSIDKDGAPPFELRVLDGAGVVVERYETGDTGSEEFGHLYEAARRSRVKASSVVEELVRELDDDNPF